MRCGCGPAGHVTALPPHTPPSASLRLTRLPPTPEVCLSPRLTFFSSALLSRCVKWKLLQRPGVAMVTCHSNHSLSPPRQRGLGCPCGLALQLLQAGRTARNEPYGVTGRSPDRKNGTSGGRRLTGDGNNRLLVLDAVTGCRRRRQPPTTTPITSTVLLTSDEIHRISSPLKLK